MASIQSHLSTTNNLDSVQRQQLLKSTRKVATLLGTTPLVIEHGSTPVTPRTRASRREGKVFHSTSATSSQTSLSSYEGEPSVWIPSPAEQLINKHHKVASAPISIEFLKVDGSVSKKTNSRKPKPTHERSPTAPQQLSQPIIYRMRSRPIPQRTGTWTPSYELSTLSPTSPTAPTPTIVKSKGKKALSESDRRRKMAKLARTLGEAIPPELVFGPPPRSNSLAPMSHPTTSSTTISTASATPGLTASRRQRSLTGMHRHIESLSQSNGKTCAPSVPAPPAKDAIPDCPNEDSVSASRSPLKNLPPPSPVVTVTTTISATGKTSTTSAIKRRHRPRSLTLASPAGIQRGVVPEQGQPPRESNNERQQIGRQPSRSLDEPVRSARCIEESVVMPSTTVNEVEYGHRRERDWSGEWNVKDMEEVMHELRCLRVR